MKNIPVYLFIGFLESGKTRFIQETLCDERFNTGEKTLLLVCEEGLEEYDASMFSGKNVTIKAIDDPSQLTQKSLQAMQKDINAERIIIEYNGMWLFEDLFNAMPQSFSIVQCMMFADATTFESYNANMRTLVVDKLKICELAVFNRMESGIDKMVLHKIVRGISRRADIAYEYTDSHVEYDDIQDPLPFDINAPLINIDDRDYAIWYRDLLDEPDKYSGKTVKYKAIAAVDKRLPANVFAGGRHVMTCCVEDIEYRPLICICNDAHNLKNRDWVMVTGEIKNEFSEFYRGKGPVIHVKETALTSPPTEDPATFY